MVKVTGNKNVKIAFRAHRIRQKWIDLYETKTSTYHLPILHIFYYIFKYISLAK